MLQNSNSFLFSGMLPCIFASHNNVLTERVSSLDFNIEFCSRDGKEPKLLAYCIYSVSISSDPFSFVKACSSARTECVCDTTSVFSDYIGC